MGDGSIFVFPSKRDILGHFLVFVKLGGKPLMCRVIHMFFFVKLVGGRILRESCGTSALPEAQSPTFQRTAPRLSPHPPVAVALSTRRPWHLW